MGAGGKVGRQETRAAEALCRVILDLHLYHPLPILEKYAEADGVLGDVSHIVHNLTSLDAMTFVN